LRGLPVGPVVALNMFLFQPIVSLLFLLPVGRVVYLDVPNGHDNVLPNEAYKL